MRRASSSFFSLWDTGALIEDSARHRGGTARLMDCLHAGEGYARSYVGVRGPFMPCGVCLTLHVPGTLDTYARCWTPSLLSPTGLPHSSVPWARAWDARSADYIPCLPSTSAPIHLCF